jgi:hypothetical protein
MYIFKSSSVQGQIGKPEQPDIHVNSNHNNLWANSVEFIVSLQVSGNTKKARVVLGVFWDIQHYLKIVFFQYWGLSLEFCALPLEWCP